MAQAGGVGVAEPVGAEAGDSGVFPDGQDHLGDPGVGERAALSGPHRPVMGAALIQPCGQVLAGGRRERYGADFVAFAVQADVAGAGGEGDVFGVEASAPGRSRVPWQTEQVRITRKRRTWLRVRSLSLFSDRSTAATAFL